jgi:hypothetical protein
MWFLFKCLMVFALFYVVATAEERGRTPVSGSKPAASAAARPDPTSGRDGAVKRLQRAATDEIVAAARDRCLESPADCAKALQFGGEAGAGALRRR